jgi:hypothetical protein
MKRRRHATGSMSGDVILGAAPERRGVEGPAVAFSCRTKRSVSKEPLARECRRRRHWPLLSLACLLLPPILAAQTDAQWVLDQSTLSYHMSHPMHQVDGVSRAAKGKGTCHAGQCNFLIAAPVKSFDSGDTNRDLHMLDTTRGAQFPMVVVRTSFPESQTAAPSIDADLTVEFAGQTAHYPHVQFQRTTQGNEVHISGTIPATCSDFKIDRPTFLTVPIKNEIPIKVDMTWHKM